MKIQDKHPDVLQNLELVVVELWRRNPAMTDYAAGRAYEVAYELYRAEARGRTCQPRPLNGLDHEAFETVKNICEFRLGRSAARNEEMEEIASIPLVDLVECLNELRKSVERHTKHGGRQGYLTFIDQFLK